ncbi:MAG: methylmalonyl-CoA mutase small subunit [Paludibacter sp.]|nr:methylmalonyl-CoA mutase small subunit [Bacteroidales bacterium]MCM1069142.1 methylmalonyl-CoA mutase small subunit [Prevotella sp.]MCM1353581.1 methylmalonyl-CoA mutase small subunit [Bacteroides sp.]MCM1442742.1 methylmalonyl-CoA mutase small subunit [Muribaculum sp.]MCM1481622.1 methylmalonyl-CoA mutase small subunit [Paludibacter sp.]
MAENKLNLLQDFPAISTQEWKEKIVTDLKGADFDKKLVWRTTEGFNLQPFYRQEDLQGLTTTESAPGHYPFVRGTKTDNEWLVRQNIAITDAKAANAKALDVLMKGVTSLGLRINKQELSAQYIAILLEGIHPEAAQLNFKVCACKAAELINLLADYYEAKGYNIGALKGSVEVDPINKMLTKGKNLSKEQVAGKLVQAVEAAKRLPGYRVVGVNSLSLNNAGAYCAQELGYALAWGNQYMEMLTEAGIDAATAGKSIKFTMGIGGNYFMEIAKFRAARMLWAMIVRQYEPVCNCGNNCQCEKVDGKYCPCAMKMNVCAQTSLFNMTVFDAYVNLLRSQTETMSAAIAGVDEIVVTPFDVTYKESDEFSERIARNQQLLLKEEAHFGKVVDPAAGSYYLETLTANIAEQAWKIFLQVQDKGGFYQMVATGELQNLMQENLTKRLADVAKRKETLLGTNQFPNFTETTDGKIQTEQCGCACGCANSDNNGLLATLPNVRAAEEFEQLRLATEAAEHQPVVFMLTIGNLAMRLARSQFSCNFFACAGYKVIDNNGFKTVEEGIEAARKAKADVIVLCSSDDEYALLAPQAWQQLKGAKEIFVVAGAPACMADLQQLGIENFVHVRVNVLEELKKYSRNLLK